VLIEVEWKLLLRLWELSKGNNPPRGDRGGFIYWYTFVGCSFH
jgi:hypothetical protein